MDPRGFAGAAILDVGCGSGRHVAAAYGLPGVRITGVDLNPVDLTDAVQRLNLHDAMAAHGGGSWHLAAADICRLPFAPASFDLVICSEVLEHVSDPRAALNELLRVLKPGCQLAVSVPRYLPERICWKLSREYRHAEGGHVRIFRKRRLLAMLRDAGTRPWKVHYAHSLHSPYWWLKCLVGPARDDHPAVRAYHRVLVWDMMKRPQITRRLEHLLDPLLGKSLVVYARKKETKAFFNGYRKYIPKDIKT
jgi:SAM-dependent methyltransferase